MTGSPEPPAEPRDTAPTAPSSMRRVAPPPWVDCESCGWRHYPDTSRKLGSQFTAACASCGEPIARAAD